MCRMTVLYCNICLLFSGSSYYALKYFCSSSTTKVLFQITKVSVKVVLSFFSDDSYHVILIIALHGLLGCINVIRLIRLYLLIVLLPPACGRHDIEIKYLGTYTRDIKWFTQKLDKKSKEYNQMQYQDLHIKVLDDFACVFVAMSFRCA